MTATTPLLFLIAFLVGSDEFLLGPILTPIGADLGVRPEQVTWFVAAYALPLALCAPLFGGLSDRVGRRRILAPAIAAFSLGSLGTAVSSDYAVALVTRVLTGIGAAGMLPVAFAAAADGGGERAPRNIAAVQAGLTGGIIVAPAYSAWVAEAVGWEFAFIGLALAAVITVSGILRLDDVASTKTTREKAQPSFVPGALSAILAMAFGLGGAIGIYALAGEQLRHATGIGTALIGVIYAGFGVLTLIGNLVMPAVIARIGNPRRVVRFCLTGVLVAAVGLFGLKLDLWTSSVLLAIWALLGGIGAPSLQTYLADLSPDRAGRLMAYGSSALNLGVASWAALASIGFAIAPEYVAGQAILTIGVAVFALRPMRTAEGVAAS